MWPSKSRRAVSGNPTFEEEELRNVEKRVMALFFSSTAALFTGTMSGTLTYSAGARISAFTGSGAARSVIDVAAHHVVMQVWWFLGYFSYPFALVAQAVFPRDLAAKNPHKVKAMTKLLLKIGVAVGLVMTGINVALPLWAPHTFTGDLAVQQAVRGVTMQSGVSMFLICIATVLDGIFIGSGGLVDYVRVSVLSTTAAWIYYAYSISKQLGLTGTWNGLLIFSATRLIYYLSRFPSQWKRVSSAEAAKSA
jgi:Na+-driven multidrug efflux pump